MHTVSKKDLEFAYGEALRLIDEAYKPMKVGDQEFCYEGRIANAQEKATGLIQSGKFTKEQIEAAIQGVEQKYRQALAAAKVAQDKYFALCTTAGVAPKIFTRPLCPCPYCVDRTTYHTVEGYAHAIEQAVARGFDDESVKLCREFASMMSARGIAVELNTVPK